MRLDAHEREMMAMAMAGRVVAAAAPLPVFVACDDDTVADWAAARGAHVLMVGGTGLNLAATEAVRAVAANGFTHAIVAHSDLPLARSFAHLIPVGSAVPEVVLVPDRHRDGTNVMVTPTGAPPTFAYGAGSFHRHVFAAAKAGHGVRVVVDDALGWDVDLPEDLDLPGGSTTLDVLVSTAGEAATP